MQKHDFPLLFFSREKKRSKRKAIQGTKKLLRQQSPCPNNGHGLGKQAQNSPLSSREKKQKSDTEKKTTDQYPLQNAPTLFGRVLCVRLSFCPSSPRLSSLLLSSFSRKKKEENTHPPSVLPCLGFLLCFVVLSFHEKRKNQRKAIRDKGKDGVTHKMQSNRDCVLR